MNYLTTKEINHQLNRIKKWINMAKTKDNLQRTAEKMQTSQFDEIISIQRKKTNNPNSKMLIKEKKESPNNKFKTMNSQKLNNNEFTINLYDYTDCKIERGIKNFYIKNYDKFLERVLKGPPDCFRFTSWLIINRIPLNRKKEIYDFYILKELNEDIKLSIKKDIQRSFHDNEIKENLRPKENNLYNVLKAFSNLDIDLGYCQGMNLIIAFLLNVSDFNETDIFFLIISMFSSTFIERGINKNFNFSIRGIFSEGFPLLLFMNYIYDKEFTKLLPELKKKFDNFSITYDIWIGKWFQTLFTIVLPIEWCKRLFDCIFVNGIFFQIQFGLALSILLEKFLIKFEDETKTLNYLNQLRETPFTDNKFSGKFTIKELLNKSEKIKIDINEYYIKYTEKNNSFIEEIEKNNIEYEINGINEIESDFDFIEYESEEKIIFENEDIKDIKSITISDFTLLEENKPNQNLIKRYSKESFTENFDEDVDENVTVGDIEDSNIIKEFPEDKNSNDSFNIETINLFNKDNNDHNYKSFKSVGFDNYSPKVNGNNYRTSFYKMKSVIPRTKKDLDNFEKK